MTDQKNLGGDGLDDVSFLGSATVVRVSRARPASSACNVRDVAILIGSSGEVASSRSEEYRAGLVRFDGEADQIARALCESLPGGTLDRLLRALLLHRASQLIVPCGPIDQSSYSPDGEPTAGAGRGR